MASYTLRGPTTISRVRAGKEERNHECGVPCVSGDDDSIWRCNVCDEYWRASAYWKAVWFPRLHRWYYQQPVVEDEEVTFSPREKRKARRKAVRELQAIAQRTSDAAD